MSVPALNYHFMIDSYNADDYYCVVFCVGQLEEKYLTAQKDITTQTRKNIDLKKELQKSQAEVEELRKEVPYSFINKLYFIGLVVTSCCLF